MYKYFVSYNHSNGSSCFGFGTIEIRADKPIQGMEDIEKIQKYIEDNYRGTDLPADAKVIVLYWRRFEDAE